MRCTGRSRTMTRAFWLYTACGLARVARSDVDAWAVDVEKDGEADPRGRGHGPEPLPTASGSMRCPATTPRRSASPAMDASGSFHGMASACSIRAVFESTRFRLPVQHRAGHRRRTDLRPAPGLRLPPHVRDLSVDFTALSFVAPEKVRFRFMLEGQDRTGRRWSTIATSSTRTCLAGHYRFRVLASNNSGVWNEEGAQLISRSRRPIYQTGLVPAACVAAAPGLFWAVSSAARPALVQQFNVTVEARVDERTRIARELHDTLLQSFQGLLLMFQSALKLLPDRPVEARQTARVARSNRPAAATTEAATPCRGCEPRASRRPIPPTLWNIVAELTREQADSAPRFASRRRVRLDDLKPVVRRRGLSHHGRGAAQCLAARAAQHIAAEIRYDERQFRLRVRDDGKGSTSRRSGATRPPATLACTGCASAPRRSVAASTCGASPDSGRRSW